MIVVDIHAPSDVDKYLNNKFAGRVVTIGGRDVKITSFIAGKPIFEDTNKKGNPC